MNTYIVTFTNGTNTSVLADLFMPEKNGVCFYCDSTNAAGNSSISLVSYIPNEQLKQVVKHDARP